MGAGPREGIREQSLSPWGGVIPVAAINSPHREKTRELYKLMAFSRILRKIWGRCLQGHGGRWLWGGS